MKGAVIIKKNASFMYRTVNVINKEISAHYYTVPLLNTNATNVEIITKVEISIDIKTDHVNDCACHEN